MLELDYTCFDPRRGPTRRTNRASLTVPVTIRRSLSRALLVLPWLAAACAADPNYGSVSGAAGTGAGTGGMAGGSLVSCATGVGGASGGAVGAGGSNIAAPDGGAPDGGGLDGGVDPNLMLFLLVGQSNMEGWAAAEASDRVQNPRVKVLGFDNCTNLGRQYNQWYTATPPLHACFAGVGPGDSFGRMLAEAYPDKTIGLVPCGISGVDIDYFRKNVVSKRRSEFRIPPDNHWAGAYEWVIERARVAQQMGVIRGIIFHQGESDNGNATWVGKVREMVTDLRTDLGLGEDVPFIAGELLYTGCCSLHNPLVNQIPSQIPNSYAVSACGLAGADDAHFDLAGYRELGIRYGREMLKALASR